MLTVLLPDSEMTHAQVVGMFCAIARDQRTTRYTINAIDKTRNFDDALRTQTVATDEALLARMSASCDTHEDVDSWAAAANDDRFSIAGSFDFEGKWAYVDFRQDGMVEVRTYRDAPDFKAVIDDAEEQALAG